MDCSPPGSSVRGVLQARILEQDKPDIWSVRAWTHIPALHFPDPAFISWHHYLPGLKLGWTFRDELATVSGLGECLALWVRLTHSKAKIRVITSFIVQTGTSGGVKVPNWSQPGLSGANRDLWACCPHSSVLAWRIPWTEEPGGLQSMESQRVRQD